MPKKTKPEKPRKDFPLTAMGNGQWCKRIRNKIHYFGVWDDPEAALNKYLDQKDELQAGRVPREKTAVEQEGTTVLNMVDAFLAVKEQLKDDGELSARTYREYFDICSCLVDEFGKQRLLTDILIPDFAKLRSRLSVGVKGDKISAVRLGNLIQRVKTVFNFADETDLIDRPVKFGPDFKGPKKKIVRRERNARGKRLLSAEELRQLIDNAKPVMKAMILLGINCGFGNTDVAVLPISAIDLKKGWIDFPRPKTEITRRCPLWPESIAALEEAIAKRPTPKLTEDQWLVFLTKYGARFVRTGSTDGVIDSVYAEFAKLLKKLKMARDNLGFYAIRHTFETVGGGSLDQISVSAIMGHTPHASDMSAKYREEIEDARLVAVSNHVRGWLYPKPTKKAAAKRSRA